MNSEKGKDKREKTKNTRRILDKLKDFNDASDFTSTQNLLLTSLYFKCGFSTNQLFPSNIHNGCCRIFPSWNGLIMIDLNFSL